jgi:hypothetical protein
MSQMARSYHGLGAYDQGEIQWRAIAETERQRSGLESPEVWVALGEVGHMLQHLGRYDEAARLLKQAMGGCTRRWLGTRKRSGSSRPSEGPTTPRPSPA